MTRARSAQDLADVAFRVAWAVSRHAPERAVAAALAAGADVTWRRRGRGVVQLEANLRRAVPDASGDDLRLLSRRALRSYVRYWHEAFTLQKWTRERIDGSVVTVREPVLREIHGRGRGSIVALPHMANWDLAGAWASLNGLPVSAVAERLRPESLFQRFVAYRAALGMEVVPLSGGGDPLRAMLAALDRQRMVCLLCDRSFSSGGVEARLLGEPARLPGGPAVLSRLSGVPVTVVIPSYVGPQLELAVCEPVEPVAGPGGVAAMTQRIADQVSAGIRRAPQDWHMLQRVFAADRATAAPRTDR